MRIYLTQHGLAAPKDVDPDRSLSEQGREDIRRLADFPGRAGIKVGQVLHSGKRDVGLDDSPRTPRLGLRAQDLPVQSTVQRLVSLSAPC